MRYLLIFPNCFRALRLLHVAISLVAVAFITAGCASTPTKSAPVPAASPSNDTPAPTVQDVSTLGTPVNVGSWFKIQGYNSVWVRQQRPRILITLKKTAWDEIDGAREGRATLIIFDAGGAGVKERQKNIVIQEGQTRQVFGVEVELKTAFEAYRDGRYEPMVEMKVVQVGGN